MQKVILAVIATLTLMGLSGKISPTRSAITQIESSHSSTIRVRGTIGSNSNGTFITDGFVTHSVMSNQQVTPGAGEGVFVRSGSGSGLTLVSWRSLPNSLQKVEDAKIFGDSLFVKVKGAWVPSN